MLVRRRFALPLGLLLLALTAVAEEDRWYSIEMGGSKVGHRHDVVRPEGESGRRVRETTTDMTMKRYGSEIRVESFGSVVEDAEGRPLSFQNRLKMSRQETVFSGTVADGKLRFLVTVMGKETARDVDFPGGSLITGQEEQLSRRLGLEKGKKISGKVFTPELGKVATVELEVLGEEETELPGGKVRLTKIKSTQDLLPGMVTHSWVDGAGVSRKEWTSVADFTSYLVTKEEALAPSTKKGSDIGFGMMVKSNVDIARPYETTEALYRLKLKSGDFAGMMLADARQKIEEQGEGWAQLRVRSLVPEEGKTPQRPVAAPELKTFLQESPLLSWKDEKIVKATGEAIAGETDAWKAAQKLERWVHDNIKTKGFDVGFAGASEVIRDRTGDCSEHGVLLAAMLRAAGIPSRVVVGLVYIPGQFGYHMWTEAWAGDWFALDGTQGLGRVGATHLALGISEERDQEEGLGAFAGILSAMGRLEIEVVEYTVGGKRVVTGEKQEAWKEEGGMLRHTLYPIALRIPEGWTAGRTGTAEYLLKVERDGGKEDIKLKVTSVPPAQTLDEIRAQIKPEERETIKDIEVGGRPAITGTRTMGSQKQRLVLFLDGGALYSFRLAPDTPDGEAGLVALLRSVKF